MNTFEYAPFYGPKSVCQQGHCVYTTSGDVIVSSSGSDPKKSFERTHTILNKQRQPVQTVHSHDNVVEMFTNTCTAAPQINMNKKNQMTYYGKVPQTFTANFPPTPPSTAPIYTSPANQVAKYKTVWGITEQAAFAEIWKALKDDDKLRLYGMCSSVESLSKKDATYKEDLRKATACVDVLKKQSWRGYTTVTTDDLVKCGVETPSDFPELLSAPGATN